MREAAIVLAGGRSSRMGTPKAGLEWQGTTLLAHVAAVLAVAIDGPVVVVRAPGQELPQLPPGIEVVEDAREGRGPLQGLAAGLASLHGRADVAFVSSTDVPFLRPELVRHLLAALGDAEVALPIAGGFPHPLAAVYRVELAGAVEQALAEDRLGLMRFVDGRRVARLDREALLADSGLAAADPELDSFLNVNEPADLETARRRVS